MASDRDALLERLTVERFGTHRHIAHERARDYEDPALSVARAAALAAEVKAHEEH